MVNLGLAASCSNLLGVGQFCKGISKTAFFDLTRNIGVFEIPWPLYKTVVHPTFTQIGGCHSQLLTLHRILQLW
jgi:hypothetical protein